MGMIPESLFQEGSGENRGANNTYYLSMAR
jgi:hypothetical protein